MNNLFNDEYHFSAVPQANIQRSRMNIPFDHKTTFYEGQLIPLYLHEVLSASTFSVTESFCVRMATPIFPVMDDCYLDMFFFFVPNRLIWDHWKEFNGENNSTYWTQPTEYLTPQLKATNVKGGTVWDYFGLPTAVEKELSVSALPFRAYALVWNEFFRSEVVQSPTYFYRGDNDLTYGDTLSAIYGGEVLRANRKFDYFSSALPAPQKGDAVTLPLGTTAPVITGSVNTKLPASAQQNALSFGVFTTPGQTRHQLVVEQQLVGPAAYTDQVKALSSTEAGTPSNFVMYPSNLYADLSAATATTINDLRQAFAVQRYYEKLGLAGSRYTEFLNAFFGVVAEDARLQRPEYLGGFRTHINMDQVVQTSSTDSTSPQGNTAAFSLTCNKHHAFTYSSTEHGWILGLGVVRVNRSYQQGINRMWSRRDKFDYYLPTFAHLGNQPILNKEIFAGSDLDDKVFGYQEAWAEYRYKPNIVSGAFRSNYTGTLDSWHYADNYEDTPYLSADWMAEGTSNISRTLAVQNEPQFIGDFAFNTDATLPMPLYSVPGLIDHF